MTLLLFLTSNLQLPPPTVYIWRWRAGLEVGKPNNIPANNRRASNGYSQRGQMKNYSDEHLSFFCNLCQVLVCPKCTPDGHKDHLWVLLKWATAYGYASDACNSRSQQAGEVPGRFTSTGVCAFWAAGADWQRQGIDHRDIPFDFHLCQGMAQVDITIKKIKIDWISFHYYHFIGLCRSPAESPSSFLLIGRWLPNTKKKKKSVSVPRCPRCNMWQWTVCLDVNVCVATADLYGWFELVGIWFLSSVPRFRKKRMGYNVWYGCSVMPCVCMLKGCLKGL